jgi:hypothetical protein
LKEVKMKKYIDFFKNNIELVTGVTIILILSNFVILQMAFEKNNVFAGMLLYVIPYVIALTLMFFGIGSRKKNGIDYSFIEMLSTSIFIVLLMFGSVIIWLKLVAVISLLEKGIFEISYIFLCIIFIFGLILTLIGIIKFAYEDKGRK